MIKIIKANKTKNPIIIHGFNNSEHILKKYLSEGYYISLGKILFKNEELAKLIIDQIPIEKLFLETDDANHSIQLVYEKAAILLNTTIDNLKTSIFANAQNIFKQLR